MTRVVFYHEGNEEIVVLTLSLRGGSGARDAAIHRVSGHTCGVVCSFIEGQWIATGYALAITKLELGNDQRFIPLHLFHSSTFNLLSSISWLTVDRHELRPRDCICYGRHRSLFIKVNLKNRHIVDRPVNLH